MNASVNESQFLALWGLIALGSGFLLYLVLYLSPIVYRQLEERYAQHTNAAWVIMTKLAGFVFLGIWAAVVIVWIFQQPLSTFGLSLPQNSFGWQWLFGGSAAIVAFNYWQGRRPAHYETYPLMRYQQWTPGRLSVSLVTSALFIIGYEFMFRGLLLHACVPVMGVYVAVAVNVLLYALAHIHKGLAETLLSVPFGILVCWITLESGSIWPIMVMHLSLSLSADLVAIHFNPQMRFSHSSLIT